MSGIASGSIRFNTDSSKLEIYDGNAWFEINATSPELQTGGTRALFGGGYVNSPGPQAVVNEISFVNLDSSGDAADFGNLNASSRGVDGLASRTRGVFTGGYEPGYSNRMQFVTIASTGDATDFGDLTITMYSPTTAANSTRGVITSGESGTGGSGGEATNNTINFITIATTGNAQDFGDLAEKARTGGGCGSPTRGIVNGGRGVPADIKTIQYFRVIFCFYMLVVFCSKVVLF